jgi:hypothetical protein
MHAVLLTLIALGAGVDGYAAERVTQSSADIYNTIAVGGESCGYGGCGAGGCGKTHEKGGKLGGWFGHMPQTCYSPRYGCYYGNNRHMNRYPAFHGNFYRRPYVYRDVFDYPWHAEMHEPTSMFSYNVAGEEVGPGIPNASNAPANKPAYESAQRIKTYRAVSPAAAYGRDLTNPNARPSTTLRR